MDPLISFLAFCQVLGAFIGAFTAVWSELAYARAMRDGRIDTAERAHLHIIGRGLRFGLSLLLVASLGLVVAAYAFHAALQPALTASYWTLVALVLLIVGVSWALARRRVSFALGSAVLFAAWWFLVYLTIGQLPPLSFGAAIGLFAISTALFYAVLQYSRFLILRKR